MNEIEKMKQLIEETRDELNKLVLTEQYERCYAVSKKMDALIESYIDAQVLA